MSIMSSIRLWQTYSMVTFGANLAIGLYQLFRFHGKTCSWYSLRICDACRLSLPDFKEPCIQPVRSLVLYHSHHYHPARTETTRNRPEDELPGPD